MNFTKPEKTLLELVYNGTNSTSEIAEILNRTNKKVLATKSRIFKKLSVNSWFNAIRKSFEYNLLGKKYFKTINIESEIDKATMLITKINLSKENCDHNIKLEIYNELINLFNKYEYSFLLNQFEEEKCIGIS